MTDKNIQIKKRNGASWDNIYPITLASNVIAENGKSTSENMIDIENKYSGFNQLETIDNNVVKFNLTAMERFQTIYNQPLSLAIREDGTVKLSGKVKLVHKNVTSEDPRLIAKLEDPIYDVGTKSKYQITSFNIKRSVLINDDADILYMSNGYMWVPGSPSTYQPIKLSLQKWSNGLYYVTWHDSDFTKAVVNSELYIEASAYWSYFDKSITMKQMYDRTIDISAREGFKFAFIPDLHYTFADTRYNDGIKLLNFAKLTMDVPLTIFAGDMVDQLSTIYSPLNVNKFTHLKNITNMLARIDKNYLWCKGNHDDNSLQNKLVTNVLNESELKAAIIDKCNQNKLKFTFGEGLYYFVDDEVNKIRIVVLNTHENNYTVTSGSIAEDTAGVGYINQKQLEFVARVALDFSSKGSDKTNWHTMFVGHYPLNWQGTNGYGGETCINGDLMHNIIKAFKTGTSYSIPARTTQGVHNTTAFTINFATQGVMRIIGYFYGHYHNDQYQVKDGINFIASECFSARNYNTDWGQIVRNVFSNDEFCFDIVNIVKSEGKIYLYRIGNGTDRVITY